ncbi:MAG: histidine kinase [Dehalococcoidia bacterium]|nr:histidine kinase [Dehalococcoidia bacterium]
MNAERIAQLERDLAEMKARIPKHSVRPHLIIRIEELEEELARLKQEDADAQS